MSYSNQKLSGRLVIYRWDYRILFYSFAAWWVCVIIEAVFLPSFLKAQVTSGSLGLSTATVKLINADNEEKIACSIGTGPVDAAYKAVDSIVQVKQENY